MQRSARLRQLLRSEAFDRRRGAMLVLISLLLIVFIAMALFAVDVAYMHLTRAELKMATDAAAKAGAETLNRENDETAAVQRTIEVAAANRIAGSPLILGPEDIQLGRPVRQPDGSWQFVAGLTPATALQVMATKSDTTRAGAVDLFFGPTFGVYTYEPSHTSTAAHVDSEICLVIDRSHSMCFDLTGIPWSYPPGHPQNPHPVAHPPHPIHSRWGHLTASVDQFLDICNSYTVAPRVALITWGSDITLAHYEGQLTGQTFPAVVLDAQLDRDYVNLKQLIHGRSGNVMLGGTNMGAGMSAALDLLTAPDVNARAYKIMILMSDGQWNMGTNPVVLAEDAQGAGVIIHTVTFLDQADQSTMVEIAELTGGYHFHATNGQELRDAFEQLAYTLPTVLIE